jgi:membrane protease YdiL (CAAX protease family)
MFTEFRGTPLLRLESTGEEAWIYRVFMGPDGLRAGWGCALFVSLALVFTLVFELTAARSLRGAGSFWRNGRGPAHMVIDRGLQLMAALLSTWLIACLEKRPVRTYGFRRERFLRLYLRGALIGIGGLSMLMFAIWLEGGWRIDGLHLHGARAWQQGAAWAVVFILAALSEETQTRGYLLASLSRGVGFWPAVIILSLVFAALHLGNGGENYCGIAFAVLAGIAFSYMIRRTGSLALVFGLHAAWDWGQSFLYGTADSGYRIYGYLLQSHASGNPLISGGSAGPEGSVLGIPILLLMVIAVCFTTPRVQTPPPKRIY